MALPLLFIGIAAATGVAGAGATAKAATDNIRANQINTKANKDVDKANNLLEYHREVVSKSLNNLGELKINILSENIMDFVKTFEQIKNIDFTSSVGLDELNDLHIDQNYFKELKKLGNFALEIAGGSAAGIAGGVLTAFGAYNAVMALGAASTGTAIASLSGAAATNATLAFLGGGALSAGGLGMAGGTMVLGGLVAGPALLIMGIITETNAQKKVDNALANEAKAKEIVESLNAAIVECQGIRRRANMFYNLLVHLDTYFLPQIWAMEEIINNEGTNYKKYKTESKKAIMAVASTAASIKAILDTPILNNDGALTDESRLIEEKISKIIYK